MAKLILALAQLHYVSHLYNSSETRLWSLIHTNKAKSLNYLLLCDKGYTKQTTQGQVQESKEQVTYTNDVEKQCTRRINHNEQSQEKSSTNRWHKIFTEVHFFSASYSSLWRCIHLMDHELINYQELNHQRVPHIHWKVLCLVLVISDNA
jgi:hypothetical protein